MRPQWRAFTSILLICACFAVGTVSPLPVLASPPIHPQVGKATCRTTLSTLQGTRRNTAGCDSSVGASPAFLSQYGTLWSAAVDGKGTVFTLDRATATLLKLSSTGHLLGRWAIPPMYVPNQPPDLTGITVGPNHTLYLTDSYNYQLVTVRTNGQIIASWDTHHVHTWRPGGPFGVARDAHGNLYIPNFAFSVIEKYSPSGKLLMTFGHPCPQAPGSETTTNACTDEGHQAPGELNHPDGVAVDQQGNLYVSDHRSRRIVTFAPDGREIATFGPQLPSPYGSFSLTEGVAVDREGNIYVEDRSGPRVVKLSPQGEPLAAWKAPTGYVPEGTPGMDAHGNLYLTLNSDTRPSMVVTLSPDLQMRSSWM